MNEPRECMECREMATETNEHKGFITCYECSWECQECGIIGANPFNHNDCEGANA